jgi:hypothetical protein
MNHHRSRTRSVHVLCSLALVAASLVAGAASQAREQFGSLYGGRPVHPACVHALAMQQGDAAPVTTAVSLEGCAASERSRSEVQRDGDVFSFEDDAILGGGSFGYREISRLENGIFGLAIRRVLPDGEERVSLAAVQLVARPMILNGKLIHLDMLELLGEVWIPDMEMLSFRAVGNTVSFTSGAGPDKVERTVDWTRIGRMRR